AGMVRGGENQDSHGRNCDGRGSGTSDQRYEFVRARDEQRRRKTESRLGGVNGQMVWTDIFASTNLLEKYWPKLVRSYAAEAVVTRTRDREADSKQAQGFLNHLNGRHETVDSEPGLYRHTEIAGDGFRAFELTSLLPKTGFDLHVAKMAEKEKNGAVTIVQ